MNANELADELDKSRQEPFTSEYLVGQAATMLRQQQAEIIELECEKERQREKYEGLLCDRDVEIEALKSELDRAVENYTDKAIENEALKKQCLDEIFKTTYADQNAKVMEQYWTEAQAEIEKLKVEKIRAYDNGVEDGRKPNTHPAKTLTDEEIQELAMCDEFWISEDCTIFDWYKFARAILRKAQEK